MPDSIISVLITGVGGGGTGMELIKAFRNSHNQYKITATDMWENSYGLSEADRQYVIPKASSSEYLNSLIKICKKENIQAIATGSEPELEQVSKNAKLFNEIGVKVLLNPWEVIKKCSDKFTLMNFLSSKGIKCPYYFLFENEDDLKNIQTYPVIIKPSSGSGSQNVYLAQDIEEAKFFSKYLKKYGFEPLIQEYVGNYNEEFTIGVLYADNGKLTTSIAMKKLLGSGLSTRQTMINPKTGKKYMISSGISQGLIDDFKEIRKEAERISQIIGANGPINIQCRTTENGIMPFEINPRFSGTTGPRSLVGYNEPDIFCQYRLFGTIPDKIEYKTGYIVRSIAEKYICSSDVQRIPRI